MQLRIIPLTAVLVTAILAAACGSAPDSERRPTPSPAGGLAPTQDEIDEAAEDFDQVRSGFLEWYFEAHPVRATELGVYDLASQFRAMDRAAIQSRIDDLLEWLSDLEQIRFDLMAGDDRYDYAVLEYGIRSQLLRLEEVRAWANDPGIYIDLIARGLAAVVEREYAPIGTRAADIAGRLRAASEVLDAAESNVGRPPRIWTEMAAEDGRALLDYLEQELPERLAEQAGREAGGVEPARAALAAELEAHIAWLEGELHPRSTGTYRLGRYLLERRLLYEEHIALGVDELARLNLDEINRYRQELDFAAREVEIGPTPAEIIDSLAGLGPSPEALPERAQAAMVQARDWTVASGVVPVPRTELPTARAAPAFLLRQFAGMDGPGPFGPDSLAAFFTLTVPGPDWDDDRARAHMAYFNDAGVVLTALHNTFPGHYVEQQFARERTPVRRVLPTRTFTAGWAHYATEMALDQGFSDDPALRVEQIRRALQRHARWYAVVRIHAMNDPLDQVVAAVMEIAHLAEPAARREVLRATREPGLMADALGRMQIRELRQDYAAHLEEQDEAFDLGAFHAELLRLGLPFPLAREILIPEERGRP